ncbi:MAG: hypothetical protein GX596_00435, partial [Propionibacterium sp.]|nr:hypothetical protein [Propionibacterium sp.]
HRAFVVFTGNDDTLYAPSRYGTAIHPGRYRALDSLPETGEATPVRLRSVAASDDETPQTWVLGSRAAIARHSPVDLPPVIVPDWIVALRPAEGGEPIPVMVGLGGDVITVNPAATPPPDWPTDSRLHLEAASELELDHLVGQTVTLIATPFLALSPGRLFRRKGTALGQYVVEAAEPPA